MAMIEIDNLTHDYKSGFGRRRWRALDSLTLRIDAGEVLGLLGPNGAGKTTLFRALLGLITPTAGTIRIDGQPPAAVEWKSRLGYLPEQPALYDQLTAREFLIYAGRLSGMGAGPAAIQAASLLDRLELTTVAGRPLRRLSKGLRQRVGLAQALLGDPPLLLLDEPMSGLDPVGRRLVRDLIGVARAAGTTIVFSSHHLSDVEMLADRVAVLAGGRLRAHVALAGLISARPPALEVIVTGIDPATIDRLIAFGPVTHSGGLVRLRLEDDRPLPALMTLVQQTGGRLVSVNPLPAPLEDWFLRHLDERVTPVAFP